MKYNEITVGKTWIHCDAITHQNQKPAKSGNYTSFRFLILYMQYNNCFDNKAEQNEFKRKRFVTNYIKSAKIGNQCFADVLHFDFFRRNE